jgi:protein phosphatase
MIVCDGIGGHEGGEVASQLAVQSIKLQVQALLAEIAQDDELMTPDLIQEQLCAIIRVANNMIAARNDAQGRESRRRMGTTLVMALQLPQKIGAEGNSHEVYIVNIGDSRAYWITNDGLYQLTVDDDVASREVRNGKCFYRHAWQRSDAGGLTQALGTREGDSLNPTIQRLIIEEDGLLLLCSDGLSDNHVLEECWESFAPVVISGRIALETAVESLIDLANQRNGHDNITLAIASYQVSPQYPVLVNLEEIPVVSPVISANLVHIPAESSQLVLDEPEEYLEATDQVILDQESETEEIVKPEKWSKVVLIGLGSILLLILATIAGLFIQSSLYPDQFQQLRDRIFNPSTERTDD